MGKRIRFAFSFPAAAVGVNVAGTLRVPSPFSYDGLSARRVAGTPLLRVVDDGLKAHRTGAADGTEDCACYNGTTPLIEITGPAIFAKICGWPTKCS